MDNEETLPLNLARRMILTWLLQRNRELLEQEPDAGEIFDFAGLAGAAGPNAPMVPVNEVKRRLDELSEVVCPVEKRLFENLAQVRKILELNQTEVMILAFFCVRATVCEFDDFCSKSDGSRLPVISRFVSG
ncbi:MAG: hypothetical protein KDN05_22760, partial [Verrucomicrobiae bacterium]|nr:hypothetical protein [Verrucomicrobiae bacterium]